MTIILPAGVEKEWQTAIRAENHGEWDALASDLLRMATDTVDNLTMRDDLLTLALIACERAVQIVERVWVRICKDPIEETEHTGPLSDEFERGVVREATGAMQALASSLAASNIRMLEEEA